ncbi:MAG TPA: c-type cytochrome [Rhodoblastus sp.]|nr:c-type cytochrome [Rhodoblastus sp.]
MRFLSRKRCAAFAALLGAGGAAFAAEPPAAFAPCVVCHGADARGVAPGAPTLAGQTDNYVQWQLVFFRLGRRKSEVMEPIAAGLSDDDIRAIGAYVATLPPRPAARPDSGDPLFARGKEVAARNRCANCHGDGYEGKGAAARLTGQAEDYALKALEDFKASRRIGAGVSSMADALYGVDAADLPALARFVTRAHD